MSYKVGKFYVIQARNAKGVWFYVENLNTVNEHRERLKAIAKKSGRYAAPYGAARDVDDFFDGEGSSIRCSDSPYDLRMFDINTDMKLITGHMRHIRAACGKEGLDPNTLRLVVIDSSSTVFVPEDQSEEQVELRKFALEKLSDAEKELLKVTHWEVYHKLADRSMLDDDDDA